MTLEKNGRGNKKPFDPDDEDSYNFGDLSRSEANEILLSEAKDVSGVFLIRSSSTKKGDLVLCVVEDRVVSHYIINYKDDDDNKWHIGSNNFPNIPSLLTYYTSHVLKSSALKRPAKHVVYIAKEKYISQDPSELSFERGALLTLYYRIPEKNRYKMKNEKDVVGTVNPSQVEKYDETEHFTLRRTSITPSSHQRIMNARHRKLPAPAIIVRGRIPNAYDHSALRLKVGDRLLVTNIHDDGMWEGESENTKQKGFFPFTHIEFIEDQITSKSFPDYRRASHAVVSAM